MQSGETHDDELGGDRRCGEAMPLLQLPKDIYKAAPDDEHSAPRPLSTTHKIIRVMFITLMNLAMGAVNEAAGPVIPELIVQTSTSYEQIMTAISMRGGGHVIGGILVMVTLLGFWYRLRVFSMRYLDMLDSQISCDWGVQYMSEKPYLEGFLVDRLFRHIDMFSLVCTVLYTSVSIFAIYVRDIVLMSTAFLVQGVLVTVIDIVALRVILTAYKESSATPCLVWHIGYCVGGLLGPLTVEPFVDSRFSGLRHNHGGNVNLTAMIESHNGTANHIIYQYPGKFVTAYWLIASLATLVALAQITLHIHGRMTGINLVDYMQTDNTVMTMKEKLSFRSCSPSHRVLAGLMLLCQCFFYGGSLLCQCFFYGGSLALTRTFTKIIFSYARDGPGLSVLESSWMSSSFYVSSIVGMVLSLLPTSLIHIKYVMQTQSTILLTVCILMYFLHLNVTALWVLFISVGFFSGPLASSAFAMVNRYIEVTAVSQIIPQFGVAILDVIAMVAVGYYYEHDGPYSIWTILLITGLVIFIASVCMQIVAHMHGDRFTETRKGSSLDKK